MRQITNYDHSKQCIFKCLDNITNDSILKVRSDYLSQSQLGKNLWIQSYIKNNKVIRDDNVNCGVRWHVDGFDVCLQCWKLAIGVSTYKLQHYDRVIHGNSGVSKMRPNIHISLAWMETTYKSMCDQMPTKDEFHLPNYMLWKDICRDLNIYLMEHNQRQITISYFYRLHKKYFPKVKAPKYTRLGKCDTCVQLKEAKTIEKDPKRQKELHGQLLEHNRKQMQERFEYKSRCIQAEQQPDQYLSIIVDGMTITKIPLKMPMPKGASQQERLKLHIHGLIDHSHKIRRMYGSLDHWNHGSDFVVSILATYLNNLKAIHQGNWPRTLYLQVDNCWRENKNITMILFLGLLIQRKWFDEVFMYCLPVGHTHEDIDQMFSNWNTHYWKTGLQSPLGINDFLGWAYPSVVTRPTFKWIENVYGVSEWTKGFGISMKGHSTARGFYFRKTNNLNNVQMFYKGSSLDSTWQGLQSDSSKGIVLFQIIPSLISNPELLPLQPLKNDIIESFLQNDSITKHLDTQNKQWYLRLLSNNSFYFTEGQSTCFLQKGPLMELTIFSNQLLEDSTSRIIVDEVQQDFLQNGVQLTDTGKIVLADVQCGTSSFMVGKVIKVNSSTVTLKVFTSWGNNFEGIYEIVDGMEKEIPKNKILRKNNILTQKFKLTVGAASFLKKKYSL